MKPVTLIKKINKAYNNANSFVNLSKSKNIKRGTKRSISSISEDLVAEYIFDLLDSSFEIWIDPQLTIPTLRNLSGRKALLIRPDICIVTHSKIIGLIDVKMDLGYRRKEFISQVRERIKQLKKIKNKKAKCKLNPNKEIYFSKNLRWNYIVISQGNIPKSKYRNIIEKVSSLKDARLFTLVEGHTSISKNLVGRISNQDFNLLNEEIRIIKRNP